MIYKLYIEKYDCNLEISFKQGEEFTNIDYCKNKIIIPLSDTFSMHLELFKALVKLFGYKSGFGNNIYYELPIDLLVSFIGANAILIEDIIKSTLDVFEKELYIKEED